MKKTKILAIMMILVLCFSSFVGCGKKEEAYVIGVSGPLTGGAAVYGTAVKNAAQMAVDEINAAGGLNGVKFKLVVTDDTHDPTKVSTNYASMLEMYLRQIFIMIQRYFLTTMKTENSRVIEEIDKATVYFSEHYNDDISIDEYAENNHISVSWFIRNFKHCTGITPMQYILSKRIYNAEILLQDHTYTVTEIAQIVGYDNPLYFSRIFKKAKGLSPSEYRKNIKS